jgi:glutathione S-transferase
MEQITLHQPPGRSFGMPNLSPFCTKLETYLRMAEVPHKLAPMKLGQMPKGKIPYVHMDGRYIGDSQLIIEQLERQLGDKALDAGLSAHDAAIGRLARRTLEEATYFIGVYVRWQLQDGWVVMRGEFRKQVPALVVPLIRRAQVKKLHAQGTGRHTPEEVMAMGAADFAAVAELLGDKPFFLGDRPRTVDATVYAFAEAILGLPVDSPLKAQVASHASLEAYRQRIRARWFKDLSAPV